MIYYLIYLSSANALFETNELSDILSISRKNNEEKDITGILLYNDGNILQVLEGSEDRVKELYKKLENDKRHFGIIALSEGHTNERSFMNWSMAFKAISKLEWNELTGYVHLDAETVSSRISGDNIEINTLVGSYIRHIR